MADILLVDDDESFGPRIADYLGRFDYTVQWVSSLGEAKTAFAASQPAAIVVDLMLPDGSGLDLLDLALERSIPGIVITGHATVDAAAQALRASARDFLVKPFRLEDLRDRLAVIAGAGSANTKPQATAATVGKRGKDVDDSEGLGPLVGRCPAMQKLFTSVRRVAPSQASVLIIGESGTGKELVASAIHQHSKRADGPFIAVNCGAIPHELIASELFGHERGSFTGANRQHIGVFEQAAGGTLFLDEVTEMPAELQVNLLRVLEVGTFRRVGGTEELRADVRLVAATNRSPEAAIAEEQLREDVYFRLSEFPLEVPRLCERGDDVVLLAQHFLDEFCSRYENQKSLEPAAIEKLLKYHWPGNVRELRNVIHAGYIISDETITAADLEGRLNATRGIGAKREQLTPGTTIKDVERELIERTLTYFDGNKPQAAEALGISLKTLYNRLNAYGMGTD